MHSNYLGFETICDGNDPTECTSQCANYRQGRIRMQARAFIKMI